MLKSVRVPAFVAAIVALPGCTAIPCLIEHDKSLTVIAHQQDWCDDFQVDWGSVQLQPRYCRGTDGPNWESRPVPASRVALVASQGMRVSWKTQAGVAQAVELDMPQVLKGRELADHAVLVAVKNGTVSVRYAPVRTVGFPDYNTNECRTSWDFKEVLVEAKPSAK